MVSGDYDTVLYLIFLSFIINVDPNQNGVLILSSCTWLLEVLNCSPWVGSFPHSTPHDIESSRSKEQFLTLKRNDSSDIKT